MRSVYYVYFVLSHSPFAFRQLFVDSKKQKLEVLKRELKSLDRNSSSYFIRVNANTVSTFVPTRPPLLCLSWASPQNIDRGDLDSGTTGENGPAAVVGGMAGRTKRSTGR